jgi:site-specific recombinase XerD
MPGCQTIAASSTSFKHSRASHRIGKMDVALVKQTLGHKALSSTTVYAHVRDEDAAKEARPITIQIF